MAGQSRIIARITQITTSTGIPDSDAQFFVSYRCTGAVTGAYFGETVLQADCTQSEVQITNALRAALAAYVDPRVKPDQSYAQADVRGLNL